MAMHNPYIQESLFRTLTWSPMGLAVACSLANLKWTQHNKQVEFAPFALRTAAGRGRLAAALTFWELPFYAG